LIQAFPEPPQHDPPPQAWIRRQHARQFANARAMNRVSAGCVEPRKRATL